ncbi:outer membrane beta-barrel protein [Niveispirillum sp. SYP-B3756]|uniref:outer membrane protein n=1 Tax=Niveispirillum sp. SYP-B3756 TaxID=2662178 RepID=UPI0012918B70|nr:outer membrane beta-barrel protein [Niveispirillum sp. SYP-B3756]MQP66783.1 outer membrane beta-barrel protein [Niveispirillum sp. SYP-B3756]
MKKMVVGLALAMTAFTAAAEVQAADGILPENVYVAASAGFTTGNDIAKSSIVSKVRNWKQDKGFNGTLAVGYRWDDFRFELEGFYGKLVEVKGTVPATVSVPWGYRLPGQVTMMSAMVGAYYDWHVTDIYQPYVGLGLGAAHVRNKSATLLVDTGTSPAGFLEAGLNMRLADGVSVAPAYRYMGVRGDDHPDLATHIVKLGLRVSF